MRFTGVVLAAALAWGCAAGTAEIEDEGSGASNTSSAAGGATGGGGMGSGGSALPCGIDCSTIQTDPCQEAICNEATLQCEVVSRAAGTPCDDGLFCTSSDTCDGAGVCLGGAQNDCGLSPGDCDETTCNEATKDCTFTTLPNGTTCTNSQDLCQVEGSCQNGSCVGTPKDCFFAPIPNECHVSECNPSNGECEPVPGNDGGSCNNTSDLCSVNNTCSGGVCSGVPKDCSSLSQGCVLGVCDATNGQCTTQNLMNGDACTDLNPCTVGEMCQSGSCGGGAAITACSNGDMCCPTGCGVSNDNDCTIVQLDVGPYGSTYTSGSATRGYWFTAPVSFTIKELRVPTDVGNEVQNIQVVKFTNGAPPDFGASTTAHTTLHYSTTTTGANWAIVNIPVFAGETIGILGARGTGTMKSSYAASTPYNTTIFAQPVALRRLVYQANLYNTPAGALSNEATSTGYGRVEMKYGP